MTPDKMIKGPVGKKALGIENPALSCSAQSDCSASSPREQFDEFWGNERWVMAVCALEGFHTKEEVGAVWRVINKALIKIEENNGVSRAKQG